MRAPTRQSSSSLNVAIAARFDSAIKRISTLRWDWSAPDLAQTIAEIGLVSTGDLTRVELPIESRKPGSDGFSDDEIEDLDTEFHDKFETYVQRAQLILGKPRFNDSMARRGFPADEKAELLALWPLKKARLMLIYQHEGEQSPFSIAIVVKP